MGDGIVQHTNRHTQCSESWFSSNFFVVLWSLTCDFVLSDCNLYKTRMRSSVAFSMRTVLPHKSPQKLIGRTTARSTSYDDVFQAR